MLISKGLQALDHLVVLGIAVLLAAKFADPLQGMVTKWLIVIS